MTLAPGKPCDRTLQRHRSWLKGLLSFWWVVGHASFTGFLKMSQEAECNSGIRRW
uniref:Uncharacterized protein n=1 Tax=Physcomitrium patens TaxID=3218 RepID=A0A2K1KDU8_PHYPA|nr:hypothetical protein PHYPA_008330 [Physcomitrium patens]